MTDFIKKGDDANTAWEKASGSYGRVTPEQGAVKIIDPRQE
jgi:nifU homolog involved in Fe-S cluster formation